MYTVHSSANWCSYWQTGGSYLQKLEIDLPYDPAIPILGVYPKEMESVSQSISMSLVHCHITCKSQDMETTLVSTDG